ncbi:homoaconitate hydratase LYS4 [Sugiyamaella lignohabitans]|uniref:Homoaconitate hydratase LYS4 n=1 Tax=Sugiyamaella lignohabitans TaxID=796027 RepID=A0A167FCK6_9ASCO|nr:homoaconitate hydratase LYS4 [Sugiyamaella lignohabitans]ANB15122.1 homoaconitate hydratase LYS4 [Sugiyamaella lignohabitans]
MTRSLNLVEKILAQHALHDAQILPGNFICVEVDWTMASEASWAGMYRLYNQMGKPGVHKNDRIWLAADHIVDPRINHMEKPKQLIQLAELGAKELNLVEYQPPNTTIMHTEFYRERAEPGMLIIGADSHTCSSGGLGALAVGLGAADVVFPMVTGETFFQVPETLRIDIVGKPAFGVSGKDVILHILGVFKRNTIAAGRVVEYGGSGVQHLSCDARFAVSNMSTEFGAIAGIFVPDQQTAAFVNRRNGPQFKSNSLFFHPDEDANYFQRETIDLCDVKPFIALYPSPDNVVPVDSEKAALNLDGCFIGACTTAEEDLIMGALVLEQGLKMGLVPVKKGKRKVTPGSLKIIAKLKQLGLLEWYEKAGFEIGVPGCSYCVGMGADQAGEGEVWLSSQNRNFKNRMGKGSIANICSAATVAASSFSMTVQDPRKLLSMVSKEHYNSIRMYWNSENDKKSLIYIEPKEPPKTSSSRSEEYRNEISTLPDTIKSRVQRFGNDVDTDAIIPIDKCVGDETELGNGAFAYVRPEFVERVKSGMRILVAERGFGCGSSREEAPRALKYVGVQAVIAKSFAYIYGRNQANFALFGITVSDERFYHLARENSEVEIKVKERRVYIDGESFPFKLDKIEEKIQASGGISKRWQKYGVNIFRQLKDEIAVDGCGESQNCDSTTDVAW